ncbi:hypothetical protein L596_030108 [Steinernema carpocapsae]|uniref:Uncharacterized protein n=1 Tax=Steinernema carpocapsae TaxID=34508 RepID=A0A4U5LRS2_STECR|nr:hypothetical protein L596_030108 [Steinernema carpocapsae]
MRKLVDFGSAFHKMNDFLDRQAEEKVELVKEVRSLRDKVQELETAKMRLEEEVRSSRQRQNAPVLTNPGPLELRTHGRPIEDPSRTHGRSSARLWGESDATDSSSDTHRPLFRNQNGCVRGPPASSLPSPPRHPGFSQGPRYG